MNETLTETTVLSTLIVHGEILQASNGIITENPILKMQKKAVENKLKSYGDKLAKEMKIKNGLHLYYLFDNGFVYSDKPALFFIAKIDNYKELNSKKLGILLNKFEMYDYVKAKEDETLFLMFDVMKNEDIDTKKSFKEFDEVLKK
jgi:hypothetical protein